MTKVVRSSTRNKKSNSRSPRRRSISRESTGSRAEEEEHLEIKREDEVLKPISEKKPLNTIPEKTLKNVKEKEAGKIGPNKNAYFIAFLTSFLMAILFGSSLIGYALPAIYYAGGSLALHSVQFYHKLQPVHKYLYHITNLNPFENIVWKNGTGSNVNPKQIFDFFLVGEILDLGHLGDDDSYAYANRLRLIIENFNKSSSVKGKEKKSNSVETVTPLSKPNSSHSKDKKEKIKYETDPLHMLSTKYHEGVEYVTKMLHTAIPLPGIAYTTLNKPKVKLSALVDISKAPNLRISHLSENAHMLSLHNFTLPHNKFDFIFMDWSFPLNGEKNSTIMNILNNIHSSLRAGGRLIFVQPTIAKDSLLRTYQEYVISPLCYVSTSKECAWSQSIVPLMSKMAWNLYFAHVDGWQSPYLGTPIVIGIAQKGKASWYSAFFQ
ncbi:hypothetical protein O9G_004588 [Rozella allomycis CSF55]|uniref:Uncharacterized protein n=1 Tax=Rozella allomycis (strain CSF55) TaxID=988480 RepID=A0A075B4Z5_ROZAC|nr:hypothetical protein O9G_004588 [Rozella allomycis CSF55]|eukprot:EPZ36796.1 hypothetical protein O9G_004588 [Rozella allomycis CSF55]